jgi:hypothetical protein
MYASALNDIGLVHKALGNDKKSLEYFLKASTIAKKAKDLPLVSVLLNNIGTISVDINVQQDGDYKLKVIDTNNSNWNFSCIQLS